MKIQVWCTESTCWQTGRMCNCNVSHEWLRNCTFCVIRHFWRTYINWRISRRHRHLPIKSCHLEGALSGNLRVRFSARPCRCGRQPGPEGMHDISGRLQVVLWKCYVTTKKFTTLGLPNFLSKIGPIFHNTFLPTKVALSSDIRSLKTHPVSP